MASTPRSSESEALFVRAADLHLDNPCETGVSTLRLPKPFLSRRRCLQGLMTGPRSASFLSSARSPPW